MSDSLPSISPADSAEETQHLRDALKRVWELIGHECCECDYESRGDYEDPNSHSGWCPVYVRHVITEALKKGGEEEGRSRGSAAPTFAEFAEEAAKRGMWASLRSPFDPKSEGSETSLLWYCGAVKHGCSGWNGHCDIQGTGKTEAEAVTEAMAKLVEGYEAKS